MSLLQLAVAPIQTALQN